MKFTLIRADDQVHLDVETFNLEPQRVGNGYQLRPVTAGQPGHIALAFPKQHVMEYVGTLAAHVPSRAGPSTPPAGRGWSSSSPLGSPPSPSPWPGSWGPSPAWPWSQTAAPAPSPSPRARRPPCRPRRRSWCWTPWASRRTALRTARRPASPPARREAQPSPPDTTGRAGTTGHRGRPCWRSWRPAPWPGAGNQLRRPLRPPYQSPRARLRRRAEGWSPSPRPREWGVGSGAGAAPHKTPPRLSEWCDADPAEESNRPVGRETARRPPSPRRRGQATWRWQKTDRRCRGWR